MATRITEKEIGKIFEIWSTTPLGKTVQDGGSFKSSTEWWVFLSANPNAYLSDFGLIEIKPQGKDLAKVEVLPLWDSNDALYNVLLEDAVQTAWAQGFKEVLAAVKKIELMIFTAPEQSTQILEPQIEPALEPVTSESIGVTYTEEIKPDGKLHDDKRVAESNNSKSTTTKQSRKKAVNKQPVTA